MVFGRRSNVYDDTRNSDSYRAFMERRNYKTLNQIKDNAARKTRRSAPKHSRHSCLLSPGFQRYVTYVQLDPLRTLRTLHALS